MKTRVVKPCVVRHPDLDGVMVPLKEDEAYDDTDPIVRAYPWAFESDVESATAAPGEKRTARSTRSE